MVDKELLDIIVVVQRLVLVEVLQELIQLLVVLFLIILLQF